MKDPINIISDILWEDGMGFITENPNGIVTAFYKDIPSILVQADDISAAKHKLVSLKEYHLNKKHK